MGDSVQAKNTSHLNRILTLVLREVLALKIRAAKTPRVKAVTEETSLATYLTF